MSATPSSLGPAAAKFRRTRSWAGRGLGSRCVVTGGFLRRLTPAIPAPCINRATRLARQGRPPRAAGRYRSNLAPLRLEMRIAPADNDAGPKTVESLIPGKCLVTGVVDEHRKIVGVRFDFLVYGGLHRKWITSGRAKIKQTVRKPVRYCRGQRFGGNVADFARNCRILARQGRRPLQAEPVGRSRRARRSLRALLRPRRPLSWPRRQGC
jgi:hypothetical protein